VSSVARKCRIERRTNERSSPLNIQIGHGGQASIILATR
jgi:hypothetical protein